MKKAIVIGRQYIVLIKGLLLQKEDRVTVQPLVSVVMPSYNTEKYIGAAIDSVLNQTYGKWDMWIVDDCSTDGTASIAKSYSYKYPHIHFIQMEKNSGGAAQPRNIALVQTQAPLIAFLDSDDLFLPHKLEHQVAFMHKTDAAINYTAYRRITPDSSRTGHLIHVPEKMIYRKYLGNTCICLSSSMIDREKTGDFHFDEKYKTSEDFVLWLDLMRNNNKAIGLNEDLTRYRRGHNSLSSNIVAGARKCWGIYHDIAKEITEFERIKAFGSYVYHAIEKRLVF